MKNQGSKLVVLSSPSGGGKTTIAKALIERHPEFKISISATTRKPRTTEKNGEDYFFVSSREFFKRVNAKQFLEYEEVHGNYYGTLKSEVDKLRRQGYTIVFDVDVFGALHIKKQFPSALLIFIRPPSLEALKERLRNRRTDDAAEIEKRLQRLPQEFEKAALFDFDITNHDLEETIQAIETIIGEHKG